MLRAQTISNEATRPSEAPGLESRKELARGVGASFVQLLAQQELAKQQQIELSQAPPMIPILGQQYSQCHPMLSPVAPAFVQQPAVI